MLSERKTEKNQGGGERSTFLNIMTKNNSTFSALKLSQTVTQAVTNLSSRYMLPDVLDRFIQRIASSCGIKKGYIVEFKRGEREYRLMGFLRQYGWTIRSMNLFKEFMGNGKWKYVEQGKLYKRIFRRPRPYDPYIISDWMNPKSHIHENLRTVNAGVTSAIAFPFVGEQKKLYLIMIMFSHRIRPEWESILSLAMGRIAYALFSRENAILSLHSHARKLADSFSDVLTPKSLGWDTIDHSQRVRNICDILIEHLEFKKKERFLMALVASCHDVGKKDLKQSVQKIIKLLSAHIRRTKSSHRSQDDKSDKRVYLEHPQLSALEFLKKLENLGYEEEELRLWVLPILCHHVGDGSIGRHQLTKRVINHVKNALGVKGTTAGQMLKAFKINNPDKLSIILGTDCLRAADNIEDYAGWKHHRPEPDVSIKQAIDNVILKGRNLHFHKKVLEAIINCEEGIIDFYEGLGRV